MGARGPRLRRRPRAGAEGARRLPHRRYAATAPERLDEVSLRLLDGAPLSQVCASPDVPAESSVRRHARLNPEYARALCIAREMGDETVAEGMWTRLRALMPEDEPDDEPGVRAAERAHAKLRQRFGRRG